MNMILCLLLAASALFYRGSLESTLQDDKALMALADSAGLIPAGSVVAGRPPQGALTNGNLFVYRSVFMHKEKIEEQ